MSIGRICAAQLVVHQVLPSEKAPDLCSSWCSLILNPLATARQRFKTLNRPHSTKIIMESPSAFSRAPEVCRRNAYKSTRENAPFSLRKNLTSGICPIEQTTIRRASNKSVPHLGLFRHKPFQSATRADSCSGYRRQAHRARYHHINSAGRLCDRCFLAFVRAGGLRGHVDA